MIRRPTAAQFREMDKLAVGKIYSDALPDNAPLADKFKYSLCMEMIKFALKNKLKQRDLSRLLGVNEARVSEIVHYKINKFTADKLLDLLELIKPKTQIKVS